ncbi:hypothetical protein BMS3Bbin02_00103 [bacterium BMS3Bbin02]|nr:hypothetical protein BMS3Bbin02_00103 [bacterium BMS3Bbin02]
MAKKVDLRLLGLGDDKLMERLEKAAAAAGVNTVEQLVDLVVDSGVSARPPVDGLTQRFTLEELGLRMWTVAVSKPRGERAEWFSKLVPAQQTAIITTLRHRGYSPLSISNDLGVTEMKVAQVYAKNRTELGSQVLGVRLDTLVGQIWAAKERAQEMAMKKNDAATFWRIEDSSTKLLQELGVVKRAAHKVELTVKAEDAKAAAVERMASIAEKRAVRRLELKTLEGDMIESLPDSVEAGFQEMKND